MTTKDLNKQFNIPAWVKGKTPAEEAKAVQNRFKDRKDKASIETMEEILQAIADKQEYVKMQQSLANEATQVPDQMNGQVPQGMEQFAPGGPISTGGAAGGAAGSAGGVMQGAQGLYQMGDMAFGDTGIDTSGTQLTDVPKVNVGKTVGQGAMTGLTTGAAIGSLFPGLGTVIGGAAGAIIGAGAGLIGGKKKKKDALAANTSNSLILNSRNQYAGNVAAEGGYLTEPDPKKKGKLTPEEITEINAASGINFNEYGANQLFERSTSDPRSSDFSAPDLKLGRYKGRNFFDIKNQGTNYVVTPTSHNPQNAQGYRQQMADLKNLNPGATIDDQYMHFNNRAGNNGYAFGGNMFVNNGNNYGNGGLFNRFNPDAQDISIDTGQEVRGLGVVPKQKPFSINNIGSTINPARPNYGLDSTGVSVNGNTTGNTTGNSGGKFLGKAAGWLGNNLGNIAQYSSILGNITDKVKKADDPRRDRIDSKYSPNYVDEKSLQNIVENQYTNNANAIRGASGGSSAALRAGLTAASLNKTKALSDAYMKAKSMNNRQDQIKHQFDNMNNRVNLQQSNLDEQDAQLNAGMYETAKSAKRAALFEDIAKVGKEEVDKKLVKEMFGYSWDGRYFRDKKGTIIPNSTVKALMDEKKADTNTNNYGGYLKRK